MELVAQQCPLGKPVVKLMPGSSKYLKISKATLADIRVGVQDVWLLGHHLTSNKLHLRCVLQSLVLAVD